MSKKTLSALMAAVLCAVMVAALTGCGLRRNDQPPVGPTSAPVQPAQPQPAQPVEAPAETVQPTVVPPTAVIQPTTAPTETAEPDTQGDEVEQMLDLLDRENQQADPLDDVPQ